VSGKKILPQKGFKSRLAAAGVKNAFKREILSLIGKQKLHVSDIKISRKRKLLPEI